MVSAAVVTEAAVGADHTETVRLDGGPHARGFLGMRSRGRTHGKFSGQIQASVYQGTRNRQRRGVRSPHVDWRDRRRPLVDLEGGSSATEICRHVQGPRRNPPAEGRFFRVKPGGEAGRLPLRLRSTKGRGKNHHDCDRGRESRRREGRQKMNARANLSGAHGLRPSAPLRACD